MDWPTNRGRGDREYKLYQGDGKSVLTVELPGFDREEISLVWDHGILNVAAEHVDEKRNSRRRTYHRRFRFPIDIDDESIHAEYSNGILEVQLPIKSALTGREIPVE